MASKAIQLVQGDNLPFVQVALTNADGSVLDVSSATVVLKFRAVGQTTLLVTIPCTPVTDGSDGKVKFYFPGDTLNVSQGAYEGEISASFDGLKQTVYETLKFTVRAKFA